MVKKTDSNKARLNRHKRVRGKISGTAACPRLNVFRSSTNIYAQLIDDEKGVTLAAASTTEKEFAGSTGNKEEARKVGQLIAKRAADKGLEEVVFITDVLRSLPKVPVRAASSSNRRRSKLWLLV